MDKFTYFLKTFFISIVSLFLSLFNINGVFYDNLRDIDYSSVSSIVFYSNSVLKNIGESDYRIMEGACTDGTYAYYAVLNTKDGCCSIIKYSLDTWNEVARADNLKIDHGNDITYDKDRNCLVVCHNAPNRNMISFVDTETLKVTKTFKISLDIHSITYNESTKQYAVGISSGFRFAILDKDFKVLKTFNGVTPESTVRQGMDSDDKYLYFIYSYPNAISIYDWDGKHHGIFSLDDIAQEYESENIFHINDTLYIGYNYKHGTVYKTSLKAIY